MKVVKPEDFKELEGKELGTGEWLQIDQDRINQFAEVTIDHQFIHVDPEAAKATPFGGTIAHGFLTLSMLTYLQATIDDLLVLEGIKMGMNYGFDKVRFLTPVKVDSNIRAKAKFVEATEKAPGQYLLKYEFTVEIEGEAKPALVAEWLVMQFI